MGGVFLFIPVRVVFMQTEIITFALNLLYACHDFREASC